MTEIKPSRAASSTSRALHFCFEKTGLTIPDQPIPWNAEAVVVEAILRAGPTPRRKEDFTLVLPERPPVPAESIRRAGTTDERVWFRLPPPTTTTTAQFTWRGDLAIGTLELPVLSAADFLASVQLELPTVHARLGDQSVACGAFVATQCKGLLASAVLTAPTSLVPLVDVPLQVSFLAPDATVVQTLTVALCASQLAGKRALVLAVPPKFLKRKGEWIITWSLGERTLHVQRLRAITQKAFAASLRVSDTRYVIDTGNGPTLVRQLPPTASLQRAGPGFLVSSSEAGMAGLCPLRVVAQVPGAVRPPLLAEQELLVTDGPQLFAPGTVDAGDLAQLHGFTLLHGTRELAVLGLSALPRATLTAEGGFKAAPEFHWTTLADQELSERLDRLLGGPSAN